MARVEITYFTTGNRSREGGSMPVPRLPGMLTEVVVSSAASSLAALAGSESDGTGFARIHAGGDVWVASGAAPVAAVPAAGETRPGLRVKAGVPVDLALAAGERIAIVDAA